jgi:periplasmic divalent cation tolerance protein
MKKRLIVILVTCGTRKEAWRIAAGLVREHLIACANVIPSVKSIFRWQGRQETSRETMVIIKAREDRFARIEKAIKRLHSYDVPEIIALPVVAGSKEYIGWVMGGE